MIKEVLMRISISLTLIVLFLCEGMLHARPASLKGSVLSQKRQNRVANKAHLSRLRNIKDIQKLVRKDLLVEVKDTPAYYLGRYLGYLDAPNAAWYRFTRPWTKRFLERVLGAGHRLTGERFKVTSLVRTKIYQRKLVKKGANAISGSGWWRQSSHLTGATIDISYKNMSPKARRWLEKKLLILERKGLVEATKERRSYCFHVMVFPSYGKQAN